MTVLGAVFVALGIIFTILNPRPVRRRLQLPGIKGRSITGPVLLILGALMLAGVISG